MLNRRILIAVFYFGLLLFIIYQVLRIFSPFLNAFFWAAILAFGFYPLFLFFLRLLKQRNLAALATTISVGLIVIPLAFLIFGKLITQTVGLYQLAKDYVGQGGIEALIAKVQNYPWFQIFQEKVLNSAILKKDVSDVLLKVTQYLANAATSQLTVVTKNILVIFINLLMIIVLIYFFLRDGEKAYKTVYDLIPLEDNDRKAIFSKINDTFAGVIRGQFVTSIFQGCIAGFTFLFLGLPAPSFFGVLTFITSSIPFLGAAMVWMPFALYLFLFNQTQQAVILTLIGFFGISLSDNFLKPILIGEKTKLPVFFLFFGVMGGLRAYGMTGMFLGPVVITLFFALIKIYEERYSRDPF